LRSSTRVPHRLPFDAAFTLHIENTLSCAYRKSDSAILAVRCRAGTPLMREGPVARMLENFGGEPWCAPSSWCGRNCAARNLSSAAESASSSTSHVGRAASARRCCGRARGGRAWRPCVHRARRSVVRQRASRHSHRRAAQSGDHRPACRERVRAWRAAARRSRSG
jgi:hypothetical protein